MRNKRVVQRLIAGIVVASSAPVMAAPGWGERADEIARQRIATARAQAADRAGDSAAAYAFHELPRFSLAAAEETGVPQAIGASEAAPTPDTVQPAVPAEGQVQSPPTDAGKDSAAAQSEAAIERGPLPGFVETVKRDLKEMPRVLWHDTKAAFGDPWNLALLGVAGGTSIALRTTNADYHVDEYYRERHTFDGDWPDTFATLGNPGLHFALAGVWYVAGQQLQDDKTYEVGRKLFSALTITGTTTMFLKVAAWDDSPNGEWGAWPSGHVSSTMAMATVLNGAYGPLVGVPMFGLTALVGIERMDDREHWLSDVVFGAVLGWVVGETVFKEHRPEIMGGEVVPYVDAARGGAGIAWVKPLGLASAKPSGQ